jgi:hypothetical protein
MLREPAVSNLSPDTYGNIIILIVTMLSLFLLFILFAQI